VSGRALARLALVLGAGLLVAALAGYGILLEAPDWLLAAGLGGLALAALGIVGARDELATLVRRRRVEIAASTVGLVGILLALGYVSNRYTARLDLTEAGLHSLAPETVTMLQRLRRPVHITFFHDPLMRETVELYELMAAQTPMLRLELHDPTLNPAKARMMGVRFAGTSVLQSGERVMQEHGASEVDIANAILRVSESAKQRVCFLEGHGEADPFSRESHDHREGSGADHSHGLGSQYVLHEQHGMGKARGALEALNYEVAKVTLVRGAATLNGCAVLVVAGPKTALLAAEIEAVAGYLDAGGNGLFLLDPFVDSGLAPVLEVYGVRLDDDIVIDEAHHFWSDGSAPAVTVYNQHNITRDLPLTFYPGVRSLSPTPRRPATTAVTPIVNSSPTSYGESDRERAGFDEAADRRGPLTLMALASRRLGEAGRSRVAVVGDSDFATNSFFHFLGNGGLFINTVTYLTDQEDLIGIRPRSLDLPSLSMTNRQMKGTFVLTIFLMPGLLAMIGVAVWWRQR
jgi:ABC-type uncharacterized transport system involved in gliding motility auxiliary subunit